MARADVGVGGAALPWEVDDGDIPDAASPGPCTTSAQVVGRGGGGGGGCSVRMSCSPMPLCVIILLPCPSFCCPSASPPVNMNSLDSLAWEGTRLVPMGSRRPPTPDILASCSSKISFGWLWSRIDNAARSLMRSAGSCLGWMSVIGAMTSLRS